MIVEDRERTCDGGGEREEREEMNTLNVLERISPCNLSPRGLIQLAIHSDPVIGPEFISQEKINGRIKNTKNDK